LRAVLAIATASINSRRFHADEYKKPPLFHLRRVAVACKARIPSPLCFVDNQETKP